MIYGARTHRVLPAISKYGGFTLVEVLAAVLLLSIGLLASLSAIQACRKLQDRMYWVPIARSVAQTTIEQARAMPYAQLDSMSGVFGNEYMPDGTILLIDVDPYPTMFDDDLKKITVTITWPDGKGVGKIKYETLLARR